MNSTAYIYGTLANKREQEGLHADPVDMMIAAISKSLNARIATKNITAFEVCGIKLINPFK